MGYFFSKSNLNKLKKMSNKVTELEYERLKMSIEAYGIKVEV